MPRFIGTGAFFLSIDLQIAHACVRIYALTFFRFAHFWMKKEAMRMAKARG